MGEDSYILLKKKDLTKIKFSDIDAELPDLKNIFESKAVVIGKWLISWIECSLKSGKIYTNYLLPSKAEFAYELGVSIGTMQNAFRYIEDNGYAISKQCIGTLIKNPSENKSMRKLTSKRELAIEAVKNYIYLNNFRSGTKLPSSRTIAAIIGFSQNTTRIALETLANEGIITRKYRNANEYGWEVANPDFERNIDKTPQTLVEQIAQDIEKYISGNLKVGDKIPAHNILSKMFKASIKTIHDALKILSGKGILLAKRGQYGTTVIKLPSSDIHPSKPEMSIFAPAKDAAFYHYEKAQNRIKQLIAKDYDIGEKLPSIMELSKQMDLSPNTIRKAFKNLADEGILVFSRGRYGGTFIIDIPEIDEPVFKWLAVNPQFVKKYQTIESQS